MKTFLTFALILNSLASCSTFAQALKVGTLEGEQIIVLEDIQPLRDHFQERLTQQGIPTYLSEYKIISGVDVEDGNSTYYLIVATRGDNSVKIATEIILVELDFVLLEANASNATTVTCVGCSVGCDPEQLRRMYYCNAGCGSNCQKTVTKTF